jgi:hypothetical protein
VKPSEVPNDDISTIVAQIGCAKYQTFQVSQLYKHNHAAY